MQTNRSEFFIKRDFGFYDSGILGCLPNVTFDVYEILRRWVWRSIESGDPDARRLYADNKLATTMSQSELADALDRDRKTINGHIAGMKALGWLKVIPDPDNQKPATYILGERVQDTHGRYHEVFFADAWMKGLWERLEMVAKQDMGENGKVTRMSWDRRRMICKEYIAGNSADPDGGDDGEEDGGDDDSEDDRGRTPERGTPGEKTAPPMSRKMDTPCPENRTSGGGGLSRKIDTEREEKSSFQEDLLEVHEGSRSPAARTRPRSHWDKPSRRPLRTHPPEDDSGKSSAAAAEAAAEDRFAALKAVAAGAPARLDPRGESHLAKEDRAHEAAKRRAEAKAARRNTKNLDADALKEAHRYLRRVWEEETRTAFGPGYPSFGPAEYNQLDTLLENYTQAQLAAAFAYVVRSWSAIRARVLKNNTDKLTLSFVHRFHALVLAESMEFEKIEKIKREWDEWKAKNPRKFPPEDLEQRYRAVEPQLKAMGLAS